MHKQGWTLTSGTDTAGGGATSEWLSVAGSPSGDRPRPPATPRCQPVAGDRALGHLLTFASVSQNLIGGEQKRGREGDDLADLRIQVGSLQSCQMEHVYTKGKMSVYLF